MVTWKTYLLIALFLITIFVILYSIVVTTRISAIVSNAIKSALKKLNLNIKLRDIKDIKKLKKEIRQEYKFGILWLGVIYTNNPSEGFWKALHQLPDGGIDIIIKITQKYI